GPQKSIEQVSQEKHGRHPFVIHDRENEDNADDKKTRNRFGSSPIDGLEARILKAAEHHEREKKHERRQDEFPFPEVMFALCQPEQKRVIDAMRPAAAGIGKPVKF